jgi:hypothetical protein
MSNLNFLSPIEFRFSVKRLPNVSYNIQSLNIPGITSGITNQPAPFRNIPRHGDKVEYGDLSLEVIIDEEMRAYTETWYWLLGLTSPDGFDQYKSLNNSQDGLYSDATLTIMNSNKNPNIEIQFENIFPISIGDISLDTKATDVNPPTTTITFKYMKYVVKLI